MLKWVRSKRKNMEVDNIADAYNKAPSGNESEQKAKAELLKTKNSKQVFLQNIDANIKFADKTIQDASVKIPVYRSVIYRDNDNTKNPEEQFVDSRPCSPESTICSEQPILPGRLQ